MAGTRIQMTLREAREVLGVSSLSTSSEIRRAFRAAAKQAHPDRPGGDEGVFRQLVEAYRRLEGPSAEPIAGEPPPRPDPAQASGLTISPLAALNGGQATHRLADGRVIRISLPPGLRCGDRIRAGGVEIEVYIRAESGVLVRRDDLWMTVKVAPRVLAEGGRVALETPFGRRVVWITRKAAERGLVRLVGQGLPARGRHAQGHLFIRLAAAGRGPTDSAARALLRRFAAAWAA